MSLLITKTKHADGKNFNYYKRKRIYSLVPIPKDNNAQKIDNSKIGDNKNEDEIESTNHQQPEKNDEEEKIPPEEVITLKNNYYASLDSLQDEDNDTSSIEYSDDPSSDVSSPYFDELEKAKVENRMGDGHEVANDTEDEQTRAIRTQSKKKDTWYTHKRAEFAKQLLLVPKKPVWYSSRCLRINEWAELYQNELDDIYEHTIEFFSHLTDNGFDIRLDEPELYARLRHHLYRTSENVKSTYSMRT